MLFYILQLLLALSTPTFVFNGLNIDIYTISSAPVVSISSNVNTCGPLLAHYNQLHHASTTNVYQNARKGSINVDINNRVFADQPVKLLSFAVSEVEQNIFFLTDKITDNCLLYDLLTPNFPAENIRYITVSPPPFFLALTSIDSISLATGLVTS